MIQLIYLLAWLLALALFVFTGWKAVKTDEARVALTFHAASRVTAVFTLFWTLMFAIPSLKDLYNESAIALGYLPLKMIAVSDWARAYWPITLVLIVVAAVCDITVFFLLKWWNHDLAKIQTVCGTIFLLMLNVLVLTVGLLPFLG